MILGCFSASVLGTPRTGTRRPRWSAIERSVIAHRAGDVLNAPKRKHDEIVGRYGLHREADRARVPTQLESLGQGAAGGHAAGQLYGETQALAAQYRQTRQRCGSAKAPETVATAARRQRNRCPSATAAC